MVTWRWVIPLVAPPYLVSAPELTSVDGIMGSQDLWLLVGWGPWGALEIGGREDSEVGVLLPWLLCELSLSWVPGGHCSSKVACVHDPLPVPES